MATTVLPSPPAEQTLTARAPRQRSIRIGSQRYPVFLPSIRDSRLHVAAVVMTIHALGQTVLDFRVSVVQIVAAIATCFVIEIAVVFSRTRELRWPASAMLTGSGVGLIMRLPNMPANTPWATTSWWMYSAVAAGSLVTKYVIRDRGRHIFNPSNLGLVFVFLVLGSHFAEPLDFWWAPVNPWMLFAYAVIITGGSLVTRRIGLLPMAATFWATLAVGLGAIAASGHAIYSPSSLHPVSGWHFWWLVLTSPETLIFVYFMLSDPKTVPQTRRENVVFGFAVALCAAALIGPQRTEFGTKVALLGALTICSVLRAVLHRMPDVRRALHGGASRSIRAGAALTLALLCVVLLVLGGKPLGEVVDARTLPPVPRVEPNSAVPRVDVTPEALVFDAEAASHPQALAADLARILATERAAAQHDRRDWLAAVSHGRRLALLQTRLDQSRGQDTRTASWYALDSLQLTVVPSRAEGANRLAFDATGIVSQTEFNADGTANEVNPHRFERIFVLRRATDRWLLVDEISREATVAPAPRRSLQ